MDNRIKIYIEMTDEKSFIKTYTRLVQYVGAKEALVLGNLASMQKFYAEANRLVDGYFFSTYEKIAANTGLTQKQVILAVKELENRKLIITYDKCIKAIKKKYYRVNYRIVNRYLTGDFDLIILGSLISLQKYYKSEKKLDEDGYFTCTIKKLISNTGLDEVQVNAIVKYLVDNKYIDTKIGTVITKDKKTKKEKKVLQTFYKVDIEKASEYLITIPSRNYESENIIADSYEEDGRSSHGAFFMTKKKIAQKIDPISAIVFADIWASFIKALKENTLKDDEWFYVIQDKISSRTHISRKTICRKYLPILKKDGLIDMETRDFPLKTYIRINFDRYDEILDVNTSSLAGKEKVVYVKEDDELKGLTQNLISYAEELSGIDWGFDYYKVGCIKDVIDSLGITEEQFKQIIDRQYAYYTTKNKLEKGFTFANVVGQPSTVKTWLKGLDSDADDIKAKEEAAKVTEAICEAINKHSDGKIDWKADSKKSESIRKVLAWEEKFTQEELIEFVLNRYDFNVNAGYKMKAFSSIFNAKEKDNMLKARNNRQYKEAKKRLEEREKKNEGNSKKDNVKRDPQSNLTREQKHEQMKQNKAQYGEF